MTLAIEPRTYSRSDSVVFRKTAEAFGGLSNMASGFPIEVNGIHIRTAEALYQACRFPHRSDIQRIIIQQRSPMTAKMRSKPHRKDTRPDWERVRVSIMRWCLRVKLAQNWQKFSTLLLATEDRPIVEESHKDDFWGAEPAGNEKLVGRNVLGRLLMELREELRPPNKERLQRIEPLSISQFLIFGNPIGIVNVCEHVVAQDTNLFGMPIGAGTQQSQVRFSQSGNDNRPMEQKLEERITVKETGANIGTNSVIPKECKRLAEVDFPIAVVSKHAAREKSIRHGHPSTLHLWWARRPLASCRAMLLGLLLPDPCDQVCPDGFKKKARELLPQVTGRIGPKDEDLRHALLKFIGDFANWDLSTDRTYLEISRGLVKVVHGVEEPLVVDPFAGGGSIPLEALRLGCEAFASDLNPVACLLCKVILEDVPRYDGELYEQFLKQADRLKKYLYDSIRTLYEGEKDSASTAAYLWARVVQCEFSNCGASIPLLRTLWLSRKGGKRYALRLVVTRHHGKIPEVVAEVFEPRHADSVKQGTITGGKVTCPACKRSMPRARVESQLKTSFGGTDTARLIAVMAESEGLRQFASATARDRQALKQACISDKELRGQMLPGGLTLYPSEPINPIRPSPNARGLSAVTRYGMEKFADCHFTRQRVALAGIVSFIREELPKTSEVDQAVIRSFLVLLGRCVDRWSSCCRLDSTRDTVTGSFSKQALQMVWDFCEASPFSNWSGGLDNAIQWVAMVIEKTAAGVEASGQVQLADARTTGLPDRSADVWFTDPPYYDSVPYADLSDFFFCWLRRANTEQVLLRDPFDSANPLTPKVQECVWNRSHAVAGRTKDAQFFEQCVGDAFVEGARFLKDNGIGCIVFAHKSTEGWEALLRAIVRAGLVITASWPIQTEMKSRTAARNAASLMGSIHLVCRPRTADAPIGDWAEVIRELPSRIGDWIERLSAEGIRGADLVFACIGPAMEVYSRYSKVEDAEGREIPLGGDPTTSEPYKRGFLAYVWETVGRTALGQILGTAEARARNGVAGALEEDARLTALFLWTLQATNGDAANTNDEGADEEADMDDEEEVGGKSAKKKGFRLIYDVARRFAQPLGIHLDQWEGRIIGTEKGIIRLLPVSERAEQLFGEEGASAIADRIEASPTAPIQATLFSEEYGAMPEIRGHGRGRKAKKGSAAGVSDEKLTARREATTLDRVHAAMLLQASGRANALRTLLKSEQERGPDFLRLANALSALYLKDSEEKRLLDAMLLAVPR